MRNRDFRIDEVLDRGFTQHGEPSHEQMAADLACIRERLDPAVTRVPVGLSTERGQTRSVRVRLLALAASVVVMAAAIGTAILWRPADTALYRIVEGDVRVGDPPSLLRSFGGTGTIHSNGDGGAVLELADTSRIEMRSHSVLSLERTSDGVRIRLTSGGIIVNAAKQRTGHLYVQTKDMTVSVVGTVFVVNADEDGSRVAVIEGEVRVQQGATDTKLRPGERVASSPKAETFSVASELAWSRRAESLMALLQQQSLVIPSATPPQSLAEPRDVFEVVSIRLRPGAGVSGGRGAGVFPSGFPPACGASLRIDPRRFFSTNITAYELITLAYDRECRFAEEEPEAAGLIGGPEWIRSVRFDIEALRAADASDYTSRAYASGDVMQFTPGPKLRRMLQAVLAERFNLVLRREMREMPVYELGVARGGPKLTKASQGFSSYVGGGGSYDAIKNNINPKPEYSGLIVGAISATGASMADLSLQLAQMTGRPVLDRTSIDGAFTYEIFFNPAQYRAWRRNPAETRPVLSSPSLFMVLEEDLGLKLEDTKRPVEVLTIERVERPSEN